VPRKLARTAVAVALSLTAALATAGCGVGPGKELESVELTVTRDYGARTLERSAVGDVAESDTVMRVLERSAEITTRYGGGFVHSIDGVEAREGFSRPLDWFYFVNGVEATVGAADYALHGGESIWWDFRDWSAAMRVPAVVGSWPQPFLDGFDGRRRPIAVECLGGGRACTAVRERLGRLGARLGGGSADDAIRVLVGPWARLREDPAAAQIEDGPRDSGVFAEFRSAPEGYTLLALGEEGEPRRALEPDAGLVAATRRYEAPPVWVVSGGSPAGVRAAAGLLDEASLRDHYAVAVEGGEETPLPLR
jgi:Domain of unknown function (DUF4430)